MARWKELFAKGAANALVFTLNGATLDVEHLAASFRSHLQRAGGMRPILFERTPNRMRIRIHDQRATFVTLALASGRTETWVADRTGHKSSQMINRYRRAARTAAELNLGWLAPLDRAIPELSGSVCQTSAGGASGREPRPTLRRKPAEPRASQRLATPQPDLGFGAARRGGSSPSSCTHRRSQKNPADGERAVLDGTAAVDDSVDDSLGTIGTARPGAWWWLMSNSAGSAVF